MGANLSGNNIDNGDFMIKTCAADPEAGYAKEKFHADPKNGIIISEVNGEKGKRLEFSADWSVVSLDTELKEGDNIEISKDQQTGKVEISAPDVGKVKTDSGDTLDYLPAKIEVGHTLSKKVNNSTHKLEINYKGAVVSRCELATYHATQVDGWWKAKDGIYTVFKNSVIVSGQQEYTLVAFSNLMGLENRGCDCKIRIYYAFNYTLDEGETAHFVRHYKCDSFFALITSGELESQEWTEDITIDFTATGSGTKFGVFEFPVEINGIHDWVYLTGSIYAKDGEVDTSVDGDLKILAVEYIHYGYNISETDIDV